MTPAQMRRAAREARTLAGECAEGTEPPMIKWQRLSRDGAHCAVGWIEARAGIDANTLYAPFGIREVCAANNNCIRRPPEYDEEPIGPDMPEARRERLVFPLLALADALEEQADALEARAAEAP